MTATAEILFGVSGQTLSIEVERPISAVVSVSVWALEQDDTGTAESATTGSASVDSTTEVTTVAIDDDTADRTKLTVASTIGFDLGRRYRIAKGARAELIEIAGIDTNAALYTRQPLVNNYATGATINGAIRASISLDDTWVADVGNLCDATNPNPGYRVQWKLTLSDPTETVVEIRNFDLVRYPSRPPCTGLDVDAAFPGWLDHLPADDRSTQGARLIAEAVKEVRFRLYGEGIADQSLRNTEVFANLIKTQALYQLMEDNALRGSTTGDQLAAAKAKLDAAWNRLVRSPVLAVDRDAGGGVTSTTAQARRVFIR